MSNLKIIADYTISGSEIKVIKTVKGYQYLVKKPYTETFVNNVRKAAELSIIGGTDFSSIYSIIKSVTYMFRRRGIPTYQTDVAYSLRESLKYRKLQILIDDPNVEDISATGPGPVWVRHSLVLKVDPDADFIPTNIYFESKFEFLQHLSILSERCGKPITKLNPIVDGNLPEEDGGHRVHLVLPDIANGLGEIAIRKKRPFNSVSLRDLERTGMINSYMSEIFKKIIRERKSLMIVGPPGSGKTTLLRAILYSLMPPSWKIVIIEDTPEIDPLPGSSWVRYIVPVNLEGNQRIDQFILTKAALRSSVSRFLIIGETRGEEAKVLVQAMNMGLGGLTTFHGGSAEEAITRLTSHPINLSPEQIGMFDLIVVLGFVNKGNSLNREVIDLAKPKLIGKELKLKHVISFTVKASTINQPPG